MSEKPAEEAKNAEGELQFTVHNVYTKDVSFEAPHTPEVFAKDWEPKLDFDLQMGHRPLSEDAFEVTLALTVTVKLPPNEKDKSPAEQVAFLVEVKQGGIFTIKGFATEQLEHILSTTAPGMLYPYAREVVSNLVTKGGFPQLILPPMNFDAMYQDHLQQQKSGQATEAAAH